MSCSSVRPLIIFGTGLFLEDTSESSHLQRVLINPQHRRGYCDPSFSDANRLSIALMKSKQIVVTGTLLLGSL